MRSCIRTLLCYCFFSITFFSLYSQTINGCYIGAYLGCGSSDISCTDPEDFNLLTGKNHYCFSKYIDAGNDVDLLNPAHWLWADTLSSLGAKPVFFLMPMNGLVNYSNGNRDQALTAFANSCNTYNDTVYIVFGHEMNGTWYPYSGLPQDFIDAFRHVSFLLKSIAPKIRMCWVPIQAWGQNLYLPYYPGDDVVDWVGLNLYDRDFDENNHFYESQLDSAITYLNFYHDFAESKGKPMMVGETSLFDPNLDPTAIGVRLPLTLEQQWNEQNEWISALYQKDSLQIRYSNLNMIIFFHVEKLEYDFGSQNHSFGNLITDWRIPLDGAYNLYSARIADPYFKGSLPVGIGNPPSFVESGCILSVFPNPCATKVEIQFSLPVTTDYVLSLLDDNGKIVRVLETGKEKQGNFKISTSLSAIPSGNYFISLQTKQLGTSEISIVIKK